jgi:hypothetical protein
MQKYICPICLTETETDDPFPKCCGHYSVEIEMWNADVDGWMKSREYELSLLIKRAVDASPRGKKLDKLSGSRN